METILKEVKGCDQCPFYRYENIQYGTCNIGGNPDEVKKDKTVPDNCPLIHESILVMLIQ